MKNVQPHMETRSRRVGGANYQIPFEVKGQRQNHLTTMWFVAAGRARKGMSMEDRIAAELVDAYNGQGAAEKKTHTSTQRPTPPPPFPQNQKKK